MRVMHKSGKYEEMKEETITRELRMSEIMTKIFTHRVTESCEICKRHSIDCWINNSNEYLKDLKNFVF